MIIDARVVWSAYFPDESQAQAQAVLREHAAGRLHLKARLCCRMKIPVLWGMEIPVLWGGTEQRRLAGRAARAEKTGEALVTGDERLFNAVHGQLDWVAWIGDYNAAGGEG